jgi:pSer/pThr/pTyr-binding forkhead associated (FHA) protein
MATIVVVNGPASGTKFALESHPLVMVGRDPRSTFQLVDPSISRMHLQLRYDAAGKRHFANDFQSRNGVYVNETKIEQETPLDHGDMVRIGNSTIVYSTDDSPGAIRCFEDAHRVHGAYDRTSSELDE